MLGFFLPVHALKDQYVEPHKLTASEELELKLSDWLDKLAQCESGGNSKALNANDGGSRSVGLLQFKDSTFIAYSRKYNLGYSSKDIWDGEKQKHVALHMLLDNIKNQNQWYNCSNKIGRL